VGKRAVSFASRQPPQLLGDCPFKLRNVPFAFVFLLRNQLGNGFGRAFETQPFAFAFLWHSFPASHIDRRLTS
jgi:hypothetical protein